MQQLLMNRLFRYPRSSFTVLMTGLPKIDTDDKSDSIAKAEWNSTTLCRSFLSPIGDRQLRLIDTPSVADEQGCQRDNDNLQEFLAFIGQYDHSNDVCVLLKPNETKMSVQFRFCLSEIFFSSS